MIGNASPNLKKRIVNKESKRLGRQSLHEEAVASSNREDKVATILTTLFLLLDITH